MAEKMNYCWQCGAQIAEGEKFCGSCGCRIEAENTGGNQRKRNRFASVFLRQHERCPIAGDQQFALTVPPVIPARTDCVNDIFAGQTIALRDLCAPGFAAVERFTFCQQLRSCDTMNEPSTPPPPSSDSLAALTMASTFIFVMSFLTI